MTNVSSFLLILLCVLSLSCSSNVADRNSQKKNDGEDKVEEAKYDETGLLYTSYDGLVMAGYQGWFAAEGDDSNRGWYHYRNNCGFKPGCSSIDFWPDMAEYTQKYEAPFRYEDGSGAYLFSPYDQETVDLHFKWMKEYGIDGVFMQRFVVEIKNPKGKRHFNKVLENALKAAKKYDRAISIMYDLSGSTSEDVASIIPEDWKELQEKFSLFDNEENPTFLRHDGKPLLAIWGVGFNDGRDYSISDVGDLVTDLKGPSNKYSIMLGVPYYWRTLNNDTENSPKLHDVIKKSDIIMPWAVGRYDSDSYTEIASTTLQGDLQWTRENNVDYVPLVFPGFSWGNLQNNPSVYNAIPREKGDFMWKQVAGAKIAGAKSLYVAMFDEIDEGTAIFKLAKENNVPLNGDKKFMGIDENLQSDYYLWLTGQATQWFHGEDNYSISKPIRK